MKGIIFTAVDDRFDYGEIREISIGLIRGVVIVRVAHGERQGYIRLISDRKATPKEKKQYSISDERLKELQNIRDSAIDTSDIRELDDRLWEQGKMLKPLNKKAISIRIDSEVLDWFKSQRKKYQSLFNKYGFAFRC